MAHFLLFSCPGRRSLRRLPLLLLLIALPALPGASVSAAATSDTVTNTVESASLAIDVDQAGYPLNGPKVALVTAPAERFEIRRSGDHLPVFSGKLGPAAFDKNTGDTVQAADFSALRKPGRYYLEVPGVGRSWDFNVGANVYEHAYFMAMRGFYGQRCGMAVNLAPEFPGYSHPACHLHGKFDRSSGRRGTRNNIGGWHDAGDYGRYMVNTGITAGTLMWTWELYGKKIGKISLDIPESGDGTPDILSEVRWGLKWMLEMQDTDGGAWFKQTSKHFSGFVAPRKDKLPSMVIGTGAPPYKSTCATADLAAVGAIAARVYRPYDAQFAGQALDAAQRAWAWTVKYPDSTFVQNPPGISTGAYGDASCRDERLWAAAELWRTTGDAQYNEFFLKNYADYLSGLDTPPAENWHEVAPMGLWSYAMTTRKGTDAAVVAAIRARTIQAARAIVARTRANPFLDSMRAKDYVWGSNGVAANYGLYLLIADQFHPDPDFVNAARGDLHYLLGRNAFSLSWVTQLGEHPFEHPHHRPSAAHGGAPWPGLLSGGPNARRQDDILAALPKGLPPAKVYADQTLSFASNEICINWQASLVFLLAGEVQ